MNKFTTITISALTALATLTPGVLAGESNYQDHITLGQTVRSVGLNFKINPSECWEKDAYGWYWAARNEMVICQENKRSVGVESNWTEEDLDTLRHEAQHLIQDCMDGDRQGSLDAVYKEPIELAKEILGHEGIGSILEAYDDSSDHIKVMELEAFAVAAMNDPLDQARDIQKFCF
tara:strand:- start:348 stop:875 length:528 start_codon:yes stop_codon:yes gene_type:complete